MRIYLASSVKVIFCATPSFSIVDPVQFTTPGVDALLFAPSICAKLVSV